MADIRPFRGICPDRKLASRTASLPYDVYHREEAAAAAARDRLSFLNIDRPETQFEPGHDMYAPEVYEKARELLWEQIRSGVYVQDAQPCYYLYELTWRGRAQTGLVACASVDDYLNGTIRKHENTRAEKERDRIRHVDVCEVQTGPIFLAYRADPVLRSLTAEAKREEPEFDFVSEDGIRHRGWKICDPKRTEAIRERFARIDRIYIADGHHRAASAVKVGLLRRAAHPDGTGSEAFHYFLSVLFPDEELTILDYNRVIKDLNGYTEETFLREVEKRFCVRESEVPVRPGKKGCFGMYLKGQWYLLKLRRLPSEADCGAGGETPETVPGSGAAGGADPVESLDVSVLQRELLAPVLGITDPAADDRIDFVGGIRGTKELEHRVQTDCAVAFSLFPVSIHELFAVADAGRLMPPKSTWFEPKLRSGLFMHSIRDEENG